MPTIDELKARKAKVLGEINKFSRLKQEGKNYPNELQCLSCELWQLCDEICSLEIEEAKQKNN